MFHAADRSPDAASRPLLLLAPHLVWPAVNGADVTQVELARALSKLLPHVDLVGASSVVSFRGGCETSRVSFRNRPRTRVQAALRTAATGSHYYVEKFVTPRYRDEARRRMEGDYVGSVLHSYLATATVADLPDSRPHLVWSHNDEFQWFEDLGRSARDPLSRQVARSSMDWLRRFLDRHAAHLTLLHVTEEDRAGWARHYPEHRGLVVPIGVALRGAPAPPRPPGAPLNLLFVGALGIRMNLDALTHFAERYWPVLRARFGDDVRLNVVGSGPLPEVRSLCARRGWSLQANVTEEELDAQYRDATFSVLPFAYATGAKLKLLKSLAYGVPVLATPAVRAQEEMVVGPSLFSDDPEAWADRLADVRAAGIGAKDRSQLRAIAESNSWDHSARLVVAALENA